MKTAPAKYPRRVAPPPKSVDDPNTPHVVVITGLKARDAHALNAIVAHRNARNAAAGSSDSTTRNALLATMVRALIAAEGPAALAFVEAHPEALPPPKATKPAPKKAKRGGAK